MGFYNILIDFRKRITEQVKNIEKRYEKSGEKLTKAEFLSGMKKEDKLKEYIPNYKINLIRAANVEHPENYKSSLQQAFGMLKCKSDKEAMKKTVPIYMKG